MADKCSGSDDPLNRAKILIVDDHALIRRGLEQIVNEQQDLEVCGEAETEAEALQAVTDLKPDLAIIDLSLGEKNGIDLIGSIKSKAPDLPILVLSMHEETFHADRVLRAGAEGYIMKGGSLENLTAAIRKVIRGDIYLSDKMTSMMARRLMGDNPQELKSPLSVLSDRESRVFELIGEGYGPSEIAGKLHLSVKTIETYRSHIKEKLNLESATALRQFAIQWRQNTT
ncbi:MAG: response regulator [Planctomycetota bacterium]|jgi:DNA-binding NarL/FixJ family response regulator